MSMQDVAADADPVFERTIGLLGGARTFKAPVTNRMDAHEALHDGLPVGALNTLLREAPVLATSAEYLENALGMSLRTYQRRREADAKPLSAEQSNRAWKFAEILARATEILGTQDEALAWLIRPAMGLDQRRPIDLIGTAAGVELVEAHLTRMDYGVYA